MGANHRHSTPARFSQRSPGFAAVWSPLVSRASPTRAHSLDDYALVFLCGAGALALAFVEDVLVRVRRAEQSGQ
jgi:hypothetical protein